ncbi:MAG: hypothetical protein VKK59_07875 [Vampirovibrionales bacterium]|nr:hypothetical protein [Vampirovibrionales bacterium]
MRFGMARYPVHRYELEGPYGLNWSRLQEQARSIAGKNQPVAIVPGGDEHAPGALFTIVTDQPATVVVNHDEIQADSSQNSKKKQIESLVLNLRNSLESLARRHDSAARAGAYSLISEGRSQADDATQRFVEALTDPRRQMGFGGHFMSQIPAKAIEYPGGELTALMSDPKQRKDVLWKVTPRKTKNT